MKAVLLFKYATFIFSILSLRFAYAKKSNDRNFRNKPVCKRLPGVYRTLDFFESQCGFVVQSALDIGANDGLWSELLRSYFPSIQTFFLIEASDANGEVIRKRGFRYDIALVGNVEKEVTFYKRTGETGNSMFRPLIQFQEGWKDSYQVNMTMRKIDSIVAKHKVGPFNFLKIDIQGAELIALKGAIETLKTVEVITSEVSIFNTNDGGTSFYDLLAFLEGQGFALYDITDLSRRSTTSSGKGAGFLLQMDVFFVKKSSKLWSKQCTGFQPRF